MNKVPLVVSLLVAASAVAAQSNVLVAVERVPIIGVDERTIAVILPTACDQQGRSVCKAVEGGTQPPSCSWAELSWLYPGGR